MILKFNTTEWFDFRADKEDLDGDNRMISDKSREILVMGRQKWKLVIE